MIRVFSKIRWIGVVLVLCVLITKASSCRTIASEPPRETATLFVGDKAPDIEVQSWLSESQVKNLSPDMVYVVHFWSTNCGACLETHEELAKINREFEGRLQPLAVNVYEANQPEDYTPEVAIRVESFVKKHRSEMIYPIAYDGRAQKMQKTWLEASEQRGIPTTFIIAKGNRIAYVGHIFSPSFRITLEEVIQDKFDLGKATTKYKERRIQQLQFRLGRSLFEQGKIEESVRVLDDLKKRWPNNEKSVEFEKFQNYVTAKRIDEAADTAEILIDRLFQDDSGMLTAIAEQLASICSAKDTRALQLALRAGKRAVETNEKKLSRPVQQLGQCVLGVRRKRACHSNSTQSS